MKHDRVNYIAVGLFVLTMLGGLLLALFQLAGKTGPQDRYFSHYRSVTGLKYGTPVYYEGYHIGQIEQIKPLYKQDKSRFRVDMNVDAGWRIPDDSRAQKVSSGLLAAMSINIRGGKSGTYLKPGSEIQGAQSTDLFTAISEVASEITSISSEAIRPLIANLERRIDNVSGTLEKHLPPLLANLQALSESLLVSAGAIERILREENIEQVDKSLRGMAGAATNFNELAIELRRSRGQLDALLKHADGVLSGADAVMRESSELIRENRPDLRASTAELRRTLSTISARLDTILYNFDTTSRNLKEFSRTIRDNPAILMSRPRGNDPVTE